MKSFLSRIICVLLFGASFSFAQVAIGNQPFGSFTSGPDITNLGNLNVHFDFPVFSKPGRGLPVNYALSFDNSVWYPASGSWFPVPNMGWSTPATAVTGGITSKSTSTLHCTDPDTGFQVFYTVTFFKQYEDSFGTVHPVTGAVYTENSICGAGSASSGTTSDGSGFTITPTSASNVVVTSRSGQKITGASGVATDTNGNSISAVNGVFTDTLGMNALTATGGAPNPLLFTYTDTTGTPRNITVTYTNQTVKTNFLCSGIAEYGPTLTPLVSQISYPDGTSYSFTYEPTPGFTGDVTGRLKTVTLRTGGVITYNYTGANNGIECADGSTASLTRATSDGTISYARTGITVWTTTVLDASSTPNQTVINFMPLATAPTFFVETGRTVTQE